MARQLELSEAKQRVGRFCSFQERSPKEVADKLFSWGLDGIQVREVIDQLIKEKFIDPQRFANAFCNDKFEFNSWGKQKIRQNIYPHQLSDEVIDKALNRIDDEAYEKKMHDLALKKWESLSKEKSMIRKKKTVAYLASKGFEVDLIWKMVEKLS